MDTNARALLISSSHPCAKSFANKCTGNLKENIRSNCPNRNGFHNSDSAHSVLTFFHAAHLQFSVDFSSSFFLSLLVSNSIDSFIVSDGTSGKIGLKNKKKNFAFLLAKELSKNLMEKKIPVELCNKMEEEEETFRNVREEHAHLCGATNVQGRSLNGKKKKNKSKE